MTPNPCNTRTLLCRLAMFGILSSVGMSAFAQDKNTPNIMANTQIHKVVMAEGKENFIPTTVMGLDDVVQYTMHYHNTTNVALSNVQVTFKIPKDMHFVANSTSPKPSLVKQVGGTDWAKFPILEYVGGKPQEVAASSYDIFSWTIPRMEPKETVRISLRAKLVQRPTLP